MPKAPMTREEFDTIKERILDTALQLIIDEGFNNLSMRKIASRLNMSATTIYNYYKNKDELNEMIRIRGFELLYAMLEDEFNQHQDLVEQIKAMIGAYVEFGITYPNYYDIMFNLHTPKYLDYVGTDMEPLAFQEKQIAMKCYFIFTRLIFEYIGNDYGVEESYVTYKTIKFWSDLHGFITLYNSRVLHEVAENAEEIMAQRIEDQAEELLSLKSRFDAGGPFV